MRSPGQAPGPARRRDGRDLPRGGSARAAPRAAIICLSLSAGLASCGGVAPEILALEWRLELRPAAEGSYESLSVFASLEDEDGIEDVEELWVVNDEEALAWRLDDKNWTKKTEGSDEWIGAAGLARQDYAPLPRGDYRLVAVDAAGERIEKPFRVEGDFPDAKAPAVILEGGGLRAASSWPETLLLAYDGAGELLATAPSSGAAYGLAELFGPEAAARTVEAAAYGYDPTRKMGAYSWKKKTR